MKKKLRYGIIGLGGISPKHLNGYGELKDDVEIVVGCDIDEVQLKKRADEYGIPERCTDYHDILKRDDIDFVSVCLPNRLHCPVTCEALAAGKHVHCEKPMAMNSEETARMIAARDASGKQLMIGLNNRFTELSQYIKRLINSGLLGDIYFAKCGWQRRNGLAHSGWFMDREQSGGGPLIDLGVHFIDLALYFMDYPEPESVLARTFCKFGNNEKRAVYTHPGVKPDMSWKYTVEDLATGFINLANNRALQFELSWASNIQYANRQFVDLYGTEAGIHFEANDDAEQFTIFKELEGQMVDITPRELNSAQFEEGEFSHFVRCIRENVHPTISIVEQASQCIRVIRGIYESADSGKPYLYK